MGGGGGGLVKVGGVDTEMYRTGHPHACSINLTTVCSRSCCGAHSERRGALLLWGGDYVESGYGFFILSSDHRARFSSAEKPKTECCHSLVQQGRFPQSSENTAHLP